MTPKTNTMLFILIAPFALIIFARIMSAPGRRHYEQEFLLNRMRTRYWEIMHEIDFCGSVLELDALTDTIIEFFDQYKYVRSKDENARNLAGSLQAQRENRRSLIMMNRKRMRA